MEKLFTEITQEQMLRVIKEQCLKRKNERVQPKMLFFIVTNSYLSKKQVIKFSQLADKLANLLDSIHVITVGNLLSMIRMQKSLNGFDSNNINPDLKFLNKNDPKNDNLIDLDKYDDVEDNGAVDIHHRAFTIDFSKLIKPIPFITYKQLYEKIKNI